MTQLHEQIENLDRATAYEAAQLLAAELGADPKPPPVTDTLLDDPVAHQQELEELAKVLLLIAADGDPEAVADAIDGAGHKQLVLGGGELIALAYLLVEGIRVIVTRGRISEHMEIVVERDKEGHEHVTTTKRTTHYGVSGSVANLLRQIATGSPPQDPPAGA